MKTVASIFVTIFFALFFFLCYIDIWQLHYAKDYAKTHNLKYVIRDNEFFSYNHPTDTFSLGTGYVKFHDKEDEDDCIIGGDFTGEEINK